MDESVRTTVELARDRDPDAWEALYRRAYPRLFAYARRRIYDDDAADDAVSEAMARAVARIGSFRWEGAGFDAWLYGILRNVVHEGRRRGVRVALVALPEQASDEPDPLGRLLAGEEADAVRRAFGRLTDDEQELLELRVVGRLSAEEVGDVIGKRPGAVRMAQTRALSRLRSLLEEVSAP